MILFKLFELIYSISSSDIKTRLQSDFILMSSFVVDSCKLCYIWEGCKLNKHYLPLHGRFFYWLSSLCIIFTHYHHCANFIWRHWTYYTICGSVCFQCTHCLCDDWENIYTLSYYQHQIGSLNYHPLFRVRSWNNGMRCMSFYILIQCTLIIDYSGRFMCCDYLGFLVTTYYHSVRVQ